MDSAKTLLHPVRLRIVQALMGDRALTTQQIADELPDVSTATVYRHVGVLHEAGVLTVVAQRKARGATERTYALQADAARISAEELAGADAAHLAAMFRAFIAVLLGDFDRYVGSGQPDLARDGVGFSIASLELSEAEFEAYRAELRRAYETYADNEPRPDRRRQIIATITMPDRPPRAPAQVPEAE